MFYLSGHTDIREDIEKCKDQSYNQFQNFFEYDYDYDYDFERKVNNY